MRGSVTRWEAESPHPQQPPTPKAEFPARIEIQRPEKAPVRALKERGSESANHRQARRPEPTRETWLPIPHVEIADEGEQGVGLVELEAQILILMEEMSTNFLLLTFAFELNIETA